MKKLLMTSILLILSFGSFASDSCKIDNKAFYLVGQKGIKDWDNKLNKLVERFPKVKVLTSDYQEKMNLFAKVKGNCPQAGNLQVDVYRLIGKRSFAGENENKHENHGAINQGEWEKKAGISIVDKISIEKGEIGVFNIPVRQLMEEDIGKDNHVWQLKFVFKGDLNPSPTVIIVETPLLH
ncbi:MAG: hypothetical protein COW00_11530 [Bdellovibrio sp. CG12_big_fil_rev_8_21_14_0_65_39_13]|nr:MAG: hypothetical protein COW78_04790 [Bdellovibrio sp. CG22_combo_CG10-13_8_21_14_all_39_27]PIQ59353.1 MAG: hypothetical protein COW00_11530 [Bdellovibrio sp. CG12_big_fil_rev_8_21_14_0_65_39_13]PIR32774.1 MAG: hypothetical protein COV37_18785 [Bdellovibrio sp. CG11_big_fil_rev_8_21_14_0_20_39_38]PJB52303.1 MAG: hypothetical protein CO099_13395 [Bdellovibrio sp. CG_4_9_14_3_um_filter_39_7]